MSYTSEGKRLIQERLQIPVLLKITRLNKNQIQLDLIHEGVVIYRYTSSLNLEDTLTLDLSIKLDVPIQFLDI